MRLKIATIAALLVSVPASAHSHHATGCKTKRCDQRVGHKQAKKKKRAVVRPHLAWLGHLRVCESGNRRTAISADGVYLGFYQFDIPTWVSVGGKGTPLQHGLLEQSYRAVLLRQLRGTAPWPVCG